MRYPTTDSIFILTKPLSMMLKGINEQAPQIGVRKRSCMG